MPPPDRLPTLYATDEEIVMVAGGDFTAITPRSFQFAKGSDGVIDPALPWTLSSASNDFAAQGLQPGMIVQLVGPTSLFPGSGDLLAVETATGGAVVLRRPGESVGVGMPPAPAGATGVQFLATSLRNQIEDVTYTLDEEYEIGDQYPYRGQNDVADLRIFRRMVVYQVILRQYINMNQSATGNFAEKIKHYQELFDAERARAVVRWGPSAGVQPVTTMFSTRVVR